MAAMLVLVKKIWLWVLWSSRSKESAEADLIKKKENSCYQKKESAEAIGDFDRIPWDVLLQILKLLGPKEAARTAVLCRAWKIMASDNQLWLYFLRYPDQEPWESVVFAEKHLRSGFPLRSFYGQLSELSFMRVYGQRAQLPGAVIVDGMSTQLCCATYAHEYTKLMLNPSPTTHAFETKVALVIANLVGANMLVHLGVQLHFWMQVKLSKYPIVISLPICHYDDTESAKAARRQLKETIYSVLFDMNVPAVCAVDQATLALFAARRTSGIVVNIGFHVTSVVPVFQGKVMRGVGVEVVGQGALKLTGFLKELMQQRNINFESLYTVRELKENLCYVAADYEAEMSKDTQSSFEVPGEGCFTLSKERFQTGEILFQPRMGGMRGMGLHQAVALCMDHCEASEVSCDDSWFKTVVLAGGSACLPGLPERLEKELLALLPLSMSKGLRVIPPPYGTESVWFGGKILSNTSTFLEAWCMTKNQFKHRTRHNFINAW